MYTQKLDELINLVDNFSQKHRASPKNGIGFATAPFKYLISFVKQQEELLLINKNKFKI